MTGLGSLWVHFFQPTPQVESDFVNLHERTRGRAPLRREDDGAFLLVPSTVQAAGLARRPAGLESKGFDNLVRQAICVYVHVFGCAETGRWLRPVFLRRLAQPLQPV